jgi:hypothetical protein
MIHDSAHPKRGEIVKIKLWHADVHNLPANRLDKAEEVRVEDWADRLFNKSWGDMDGNFTCINYAYRAGLAGPDKPCNDPELEDEVVYVQALSDGHWYSHLVHESELLYERNI